MKKIIIILFFAVNSIFAQKTFNYALPQKVIVVGVPVTKIIREKGDCYGFDKDILKKRGIELKSDFSFDCAAENDKTIENGKTKKAKREALYKDESNLGFKPIEFKIGEIEINTRPVKDPSKIFEIALEKRVMKKFGFGLELNPFAIPTSIESTFENKTFEVVTTGLVTIAKIAFGAKDVGLIGEVKKQYDSNETCDCGKSWNKLQTFLSKKESIITDPSSLRDGQTLKTYLEIIDKEIEDLEAVFTYSLEKQSALIYREFLFNDNNKDSMQSIFYVKNDKTDVIFDKKAKIDFLSNPDRLPLKITTSNNELDSKFKIKIERYLSEKDVRNLSKAIPTLNTLAYNIPSIYRVVILEGTNEIKDLEVLMPQFGEVGVIPYNLNKTKIVYDENGSIKSLLIDSEAILSSDKVKTAGETFDTLTKKKVEKTKDEKEIEALEAEKKRVTLEKDILEAKKNIKNFKKDLEIKD